MILSFNLLKKIVPLPDRCTAKDIKLRLTTSTVEVENIEPQVQNLGCIVVGRIDRLEKHPNADKLWLATVSFGKRFPPERVVCGGTNLREGMFVAFAQVGAMVRWHGQGELVRLETATIRGVSSSGMICAAEEIGLADLFSHGAQEVVDVTDLNLVPGMALARALNLDDTRIHIDNKSITNRPDLWSHYGIARELAALYGVKLTSPDEYARPFPHAQKPGITITIKNTKACPRYIGAVIANVTIQDSPSWMKKALIAAGIRPINNVVDITNYVLIELGQPMHVFDDVLLAHDAHGVPEIVVRNAKLHETIVLLDGAKQILTDDMLVIADAKQAVALAGIMGGAVTGVSEHTKIIVLEAANFDAATIRRASQILAIRTESSIRFEKALHPELAERAMRRALYLLCQMLPDAVVIEVSDKNYAPARDVSVRTSYEFLEQRIGCRVGRATINGIMKKLGFTVTSAGAGGRITVGVPWWRATGDIKPSFFMMPT
jgi:phenylalanyl-tRNA synthetase beta chain